MRSFNTVPQAFVVGLAWFISAVGSILLRHHARAVPLLWLPSAIGVSALFVASPKERPIFLAALAVASLAVHSIFGVGLVRIAPYILSNLVEPLIAVAVARRVVRNRHLGMLNLRDMMLLFAGAALGSCVGTLIVYPLRMDQGWIQMGWWAFATTLGIAVGSPILVHLHGWIRRQTSWRKTVADLPTSFLMALAAMLVLSLWVVSTPFFSLTQLVLAGIVFVVVRYGPLGAASGILAFGAAGTIESIGWRSPAAYLDYSPFEGAVILQSFMVLMMATSLPLSALLLRNRRLASRLKVRNLRMRESLLMLGMAEEIGRIGRWRYEPGNESQDWSRQMCLIHSVDPARRNSGKPLDLIEMAGADFLAQLSGHAKDRARYGFEYRIARPHSDTRILKMYANNEFDQGGNLTCIFGVVMDVTEHHQRQEALDRERTRAMRLAAEAQYLAHTDPLTGLANRRRTISQLEKCIRRAQQGHRPLGVISFDIDHFKRINDTRGHQTGDDVLVRIADIARRQTRASDLVGRMGGEEFVWILPDAGAHETRHAAERLRKAIERESSSGPLPAVTASVGYASWRDDDDAGTLLARVDAALYAAKQAGRNTVQKAA